MGFWRTLFATSSGDSVKTGTQHPIPHGRDRSTTVTFDNAMQVSAFWASVRLLTETVAAMPLKAYAIDPATGTKKPDPNNDLWRLLQYRPNRYQTKIEFFESLMLNLVTHGNFYGSLQRDTTGDIVQILPLMASQMTVQLLPNGDKSFHYTDANGNVRVYAAASIWHINLFGNGLVGLSPMGYAAKVLGIAINLEARVSKLASNGGKTTGVLMVDDRLTPEQRKQIRTNYKGLEENSEDNLFILEANMRYEQTSLSPSDIQMLENRRFTVEDIARFMGVPSVLITASRASTAWGSGIEQINMGFYKLNLRPYLERIEASIKRWLVDSGEWATTEIEFDFDSLLRADQATRLDGYSKAINSGQMTPNEARAKEGRDRLPGGDDIYLNGTLVPAGQINEAGGEQNGI